MAPVCRILLYRSSVFVRCGVYRTAGLVAGSNRVAALRAQIFQGGVLGLRLGLLCPHRRIAILNLFFGQGDSFTPLYVTIIGAAVIGQARKRRILTHQCQCGLDTKSYWRTPPTEPAAAQT